MELFMKLYVGNLPNAMTEDELSSTFKAFGDIQSLHIIKDRETGRSRGFGFIEISDDGANKAIQELNDSEIQGRKIIVNEAMEKKQNNRRSY